jgi:hypothetical protein
MAARATAFLCAILVSSLGVVRAEQDHLIGYRVKDLNGIAPSGSYTLSSQLGTQVCEPIAVRYLLERSEKNGGDDPRGGPAGRFVCYVAKCSGTLPDEVQASGQFAAHTLGPKSTQLLCVPVQPAGCPGVTVGGFCWLLGASGQSCDAVCGTLAYDSATLTYAGSSGTDANCEAVLDALGVPAGSLFSGTCSEAVGCAYTGTSRLRCTSPQTDSSTGSAGYERACACK